MGLRYAVITSVTRDDLPDGGAEHWAETVRAIKRRNPQTAVELLIPDFDGRKELIDIVLAAGADVVGHNVETTRRLTPLVRARAKYETSLATLRHIAESGVKAKSGIMVGLGETDDEIIETLADLREAGCRIVTLGQYLRPTEQHYPVAEFITPEKFEYYKAQAERLGFDYVASAPLVRSSYMAERALDKCGD
jgi:lipoic acid synthetase